VGQRSGAGEWIITAWLRGDSHGARGRTTSRGAGLGKEVGAGADRWAMVLNRLW
jgi:hypothetical protein